jgi:hypothetical protein
MDDSVTANSNVSIYIVLSIPKKVKEKESQMMEMDDNKLKRFLQSELDKEADIMMEQINKDPNMADVVAPDEMFDKL